MKNEKIISILKAHSVPYFEKGGRVYADSMYAELKLFEEVVDLTGYSLQALLEWLGY